MLNKFYEFEKNEQVIDFKYSFNNEIIWPYFRYAIINKIISEEVNQGQVDIFMPNKGKFLVRNVYKNPFLEKNKDIVFFCSDISDNKNEDGFYFNYLYDYYCEIYEDSTLMIEYACKDIRPEPRYFKNVKYEDFIDDLVELKSKINKKKYSDKDIVISKKLIEYLKKNLTYKFESGFYIGLENQILDMSIKIKYYYKYYLKLLKRLKPKVIFMEAACYGTAPRICIIKIAKSLGIKTAEFQHGIIVPEAGAYSYPNYFKENEDIKKYFPDHLLMMGEYWNDKVNVPCKIKVIGTPHLCTKAKINDNVKTNNDIDTILIVCSMFNREEYIQLVEKLCLSEQGGKYKIIFRLHPKDRINIKKYCKLLEYNNVEINTDGEIYDYISKSKYIIGSESTVLYEATIYKKNILIFENKLSKQYIANDLGRWFKDCDGLIEILKEDNENDYSYNYYWEMNWRENYISFIENEIYGENK